MSLICTARTEGFWQLNIHLCKETWGRLCDINTADAAVQFMSCTRVTRLSLWPLLSTEALLFAVCQYTFVWWIRPQSIRLFSAGYTAYEHSRPPAPHKRQELLKTFDIISSGYINNTLNTLIFCPRAQFLSFFFSLCFYRPCSCITVCSGCLTTMGKVKPLIRISQNTPTVLSARERSSSDK